MAKKAYLLHNFIITYASDVGEGDGPGPSYALFDEDLVTWDLDEEVWDQHLKSAWAQIGPEIQQAVYMDVGYGDANE